MNCPSCGMALSGNPKFCPECGTKLVAVQTARGEVRKTVTVLFCDVAGSTALGERLDPENVRRVMSGYFAAMQAVIERHGGTVEKFVGDAIMAVFGIPTLREDDALRAVRAAAEMRDALADLNAALEQERGLSIATRTGITTGEVVAGSAAADGTLVTGDTVNTAARLEQAAEAGEILIGTPTFRLVRDAVSAEPVEPIDAKGKALPVPAYRLLAVDPGAAGHARRLDAPLVGRERELRLLRHVWERGGEERAPQLFTLLGAAGVGKSRLVAEFVARLGAEADILRGRCLPYGEGITYWPLAEALKQAAGITEADVAETARARLDDLIAAERDAAALSERLAEAIGLASGGAPQEELFWAVRRTLEARARRRPLVVVWDDLHWAQPTFLDLVEHIADWSRDAPLLILAMARPELLEVRPGWGGGKLNATTVLLEALGTDATAQLISALPGGEALPPGLHRRISDAAEGNPLFVEEMLAILFDEGHLVAAGDSWRAAGDLEAVPVPPSISALLAARLEKLAPEERGVAERASVVGRSFERGAVAELSPEPERHALPAHLLALVRKELLRPELEPGLAGDESFRFRHLLIRDAAYAGVPKTERAALHERFAAWLERVTGDRLLEYEEIVGHHLAQAYRYRIELGENDERAGELGRRAAARMASAGHRAQTRGDMTAAASLYSAALALPLAAEARARLQTDLARALIDAGDWAQARTEIDGAARVAAETGDARWQAHVGVLRGALASEVEQRPNHDEIEAEAHRAIATFRAHGDELGLARAWDLVANSAFIRGAIDVAGSAWLTADEHARRANDPAEEARIQTLLPATTLYGWTTSGEALQLCEELAARGASPMFRARLSAIQAFLHAEIGDQAGAKRLRAESLRLLNELAVPWLTVETRQIYAQIDMLTEAWAAAELELRGAFELASEHRLRQAGGLMSYLVEAVLRQGRMAEAEGLLAETDQLPGVADPTVAPRFVLLRAWLAADDGDGTNARAILADVTPEELERLHNLDRDDLLGLRAEVYHRLGDWRGAAADLAGCLEICERREFRVRAQSTRSRLEETRRRAGSASIG